MIGAAVGIPAVALALAPAPASAGAGTTRAVALSAAPAHVTLVGNARTAVHVTNTGTKRVVVDISRAGFALDLRGRPRIVPRGGARSAAPWLTLQPKHLLLAPHASASLVVASKLPRRAAPGDHDALMVLSTRRLGGARVAVRVRMGVVVVVRAPGRTVRRLKLRRLRVTRRGRARAFDVLVANRGNVNESLTRARAVVSLAGGGRPIATLVAASRDLRPRTSGIVEFPFRGLLHGRITARIVIPAEPGRSAVTRTYRIRL
jgi:hypothetical protein